jgi:hypothetical protein
VTYPSAGLGAQHSRRARFSVNRLRKIWKPVPMSGDMTVTRSRTWHFSHTLYTSLKPEAVRGLRNRSIDPRDIINHMFIDLFKQGPDPAAVSYIHLRVSREAFDHCVACGRSGSALPNLPFTGFIQAKSAVRKTILQTWLNAFWTPVGSKLSSAPQYRDEFMEPTHAAFVYFLVRGVPALGTAGRRRRSMHPTAPAVITFAYRLFGSCCVILPCWIRLIIPRCDAFH